MVDVQIQEPGLEILKKSSAIEAVTDGQEDQQGWRQVSIRFGEEAHARRVLLGLGGAVKILEPASMRMTVEAYARQILKNYEHS